MTVTRAAELRMKWKEQVNPPPCEHHDLKLERTDTGYLTGNYNCIVCGDGLPEFHDRHPGWANNPHP